MNGIDCIDSRISEMLLNVQVVLIGKDHGLHVVNSQDITASI